MITVTNLKKNYSDFSLNITMTIPKGRITGLVGKNGAGKSTTIKAILGLIKPDSGTVTVLGKEASTLSAKEKKQLAAALSDSGFSNYLTLKDVSKILTKMYDSFDAQAFLKKCKSYGLSEEKLLLKYSTGMKAKLRVLVALSHDARLLILDEPTAGMDVSARYEILDMLREYIAEDENRTLLITSHIATDLEGICDDIYLIDNGKIVLHEETDVILSDYAIIKTDNETYKTLEAEYLLCAQKEEYGWRCLTNQKQFFIENHPGMVIEKSGIDDLILMLTGGAK